MADTTTAGEAMSGWVYCDCAGKHKDGCPNDKPGGLPPLNDDDD